MTLSRLVLSLTLLFALLPTFAQQPVAATPVTKDPQAVQLATASLAALSGSIQISDITLTGTATRTEGSDVESGNFTLQGLGTTDSRLDLNLSNGLTREIRNTDSNGVSQGFLIKPSASAIPYAQHNCMTSAVWFFPALSVLSRSTDPAVALSFVDQETKLGRNVNRLRFEVQNPDFSASDNALLGQLSEMDFYLDASSNLPVAIIFNAHSDTDAGINLVEEIDFSNYQNVNGAEIPFRVQKFFNGSLLLDLTVQHAGLNTGITQSVFTAN